MAPLALHEFHLNRGASFSNQNGFEAVASYGQPEAEYTALTQRAGLLDLSFRSRICLLGTDREKFLHGQVTNDVLRLKTGDGAYAALVTAKGKVESDLFIYKLQDELLLDFEPGLTPKISNRLEKYVIAEDVQIVDVAPFYNLLSILGPDSATIVSSQIHFPLPEKTLSFTKASSASGELYIVRNDRFGIPAFDLFVPSADALTLTEKLSSQIKLVGMDACEMIRVEKGIPRFGVDIDESNLAPEALGENAISYAKGCYIGQEVIARIRTYGQVAKALRLLRFAAEPQQLPSRGDKLFKAGKEVGLITSSTFSPRHRSTLALAYVRKECNSPGDTLHLGAPDGPLATIIVA